MGNENAAGRVASVLRAEILQGDLAPGARLSQQCTAERFGVSRIPVRDALAILAGEGLVQPSANATAVVTGMSVAELQELYELRQAVEPVATELAVPNVGRADILSMRHHLDVMRKETDARRWLSANTAFHASVYRQANRPRMIELVEQLRCLTDRYMYFHLEIVGQTEHLDAEHLKILDAVERGDGPLAAQLTRDHLASSHDFILTHMLEIQGAAGLDGTDALTGPRRQS